MTNNLSTRAIAYFRAHEGVVPHMYLCVHGRVTAGVGHMFPSAEAASRLLWERQNRTIAPRAEVIAEYERIAALPFGYEHPAGGYRKHATVFLPPERIDGLLRADIQTFEQSLAAAFRDWDSWPIRAQLAVLDMAYSLGVRGLLTRFPRFTAAARKRDWATCAAESKRIGVSASRNEAVAELLDPAKMAYKFREE